MDDQCRPLVHPLLELELIRHEGTGKLQVIYIRNDGKIPTRTSGSIKAHH